MTVSRMWCRDYQEQIDYVTTRYILYNNIYSQSSSAATYIYLQHTRVVVAMRTLHT